MRIGQNFHDREYGQCVVISITQLTFGFRDSSGKRHRRRRPEAKRWRVGARCLVTPDAELPNDACIGVVVDTKGGKPDRIRLTQHPVWDGAVIHAREVFRLQALDVGA